MIINDTINNTNELSNYKLYISDTITHDNDYNNVLRDPINNYIKEFGKNKRKLLIFIKYYFIIYYFILYYFILYYFIIYYLINNLFYNLIIIVINIVNDANVLKTLYIYKPFKY